MWKIKKKIFRKKRVIDILKVIYTYLRGKCYSLDYQCWASRPDGRNREFFPPWTYSGGTRHKMFDSLIYFILI